MGKKNMFAFHFHLSESKFKELAKCFAFELDTQKASDMTNLKETPLTNIIINSGQGLPIYVKVNLHTPKACLKFVKATLVQEG